MDHFRRSQTTCFSQMDVWNPTQNRVDRNGGRSGFARTAWAMVALMLCVWQCGCVQRRMTVRTNPPGALLYVDDYEIGVTPISTNFTYYGTRKIKLVKDGFETLTVMQSFPPPWYDFFPIDFVSENLVPGEIRDQRTLDFQLKPQVMIPSDQLRARAEELRRSTHASAVVPAGGSVPVGSPVPNAGGQGVANPPVFPPYPQPSAAEVLPVPQGVGGQPIHPLPGGR